MAAVFALVFMFVISSIGLLVRVCADGASWGSTLALATFIALASGVFVGLYRLARRWEGEAGPEH